MVRSPSPIRLVDPLTWTTTWIIVALIVTVTTVIVAALLAMRGSADSLSLPPRTWGWYVEMWNIYYGYRVELRFASNIVLGRVVLQNHIVGRAPAEIDRTISREHCMFYEQDNMLLAWNMSAVNPMVINGYRSNVPVRLQPGDRMELGNSTFLVTRVERTGE